MILEIRDENGNLPTITRGILNTFVGYMKRKYGPIQVDVECLDLMVNAGHIRVAEAWDDNIDIPITAEEIHSGAQRGGKQSARA